jgi:hypothetical protein
MSAEVHMALVVQLNPPLLTSSVVYDVTNQQLKNIAQQ